MMTFEKFSEYCPKQYSNKETGTIYCDAARCRCSDEECITFHLYKKLAKAVEKLQIHCHQHDLAVVEFGCCAGYDRGVVFEGEDEK